MLDNPLIFCLNGLGYIMKISIFKSLAHRLKRWFGYVEFLGRARRGAAKRLTLPDLEREVRAHMGVALTAKSRPPRFAALRYALFGTWGLAPWITEDAIQKFEKEYWDGNVGGLPHTLTPSLTRSIFSLTPALIGISFWWPLSELLGVISFICGLIGACVYTIFTFIRLNTAHRFVANCMSKSSQATATVTMPEAIARYVAHRLGEVKEDLVGARSEHAKTNERAQNEMSRVLVVWERLRLRLLNLHLAVPLDLHDHWTDERMPEHLRVAYEQVYAMFLRAEKTLNSLSQFEARVRALVEEMSLEARRDLALYEDIDLLDEIRDLGGRVAQTAVDARRSIAQALESLQERMDALRVDVVQREKLIGSVVAALPSAPDRDAEWQRLEDVVQGLSIAPARPRTLA